MLRDEGEDNDAGVVINKFDKRLNPSKSGRSQPPDYCSTLSGTYQLVHGDIYQ